MKTKTELEKIQSSYLPHETLKAISYFDQICILDELLEGKPLKLPSDIKAFSERKALVQPLRDWVFYRDEFTCARCNGNFPPFELECDHVIPLALGGETIPDNLQTLCKRCHKEKTKDDISKIKKLPISSVFSQLIFEFED